ncbi:hypothetical protein EGM51_14305 [Verrucomicrobia bacterium S94]|nr:hypothetical protein EGM51_14305 [Verrucomicrobia bacterium S94]
MKTVFSAVTAATLILCGCSTMKTGETALEVKSSSEVRITNVRVSNTASGITVTGTLRPARSTVRLAGHVDIEFMNADGELQKAIRVDPNVGHFSKHTNMRRPEFSVSTKLNEPIAVIRVAHHADALKTCGL